MTKRERGFFFFFYKSFKRSSIVQGNTQLEHTCTFFYNQIGYQTPNQGELRVIIIIIIIIIFQYPSLTLKLV